MIYKEVKGTESQNSKEFKEIKTQDDKPQHILDSEEYKKPSFLDDIIKQPTLKPTQKDETKTYKPIDEHEDIKEILRRRRKDLEPDDDESESEEWGEGLKQKNKGAQAQDKVIKFKALMKLLK